LSRSHDRPPLVENSYFAANSQGRNEATLAYRRSSHAQESFGTAIAQLSLQSAIKSVSMQRRPTMNLGEQFRSDVVTVSPDDTIQAAVWKMKDENVGAVVVLKNRKVVGILTDRDVALALGLGEAELTTPVKEVMTKDVLTIWEDQGVFNATQYLMGHQIRRLPIINRKDELVGMVTMDDVFALLAQELKNLAQAVTPALAEKASV